MSIQIAVCVLCNHLDRRALREQKRLVCPAFPNGVPREIREGYHEHRTPFPGDHGIRFELWDELKGKEIWKAWETAETDFPEKATPEQAEEA